ncbi:Exostosin family protein [Quillaja saponaria]|uniref:Exostosin family protein n=1 Tax=Quillaja saponaria TaxID=32244 RepID=A0AAD7LKP5_QUISA|nr:Exostosin family protein [Quillaja saponaria]
MGFLQFFFWKLQKTESNIEAPNLLDRSSRIQNGRGSVTAPAPQKAKAPEYANRFENVTYKEHNSPVSSVRVEGIASTPVGNENSGPCLAPSCHRLPPIGSLTDITPPNDMERESMSPLTPKISNMTPVGGDVIDIAHKGERSGSLQGDNSVSNYHNPTTSVPNLKNKSWTPPSYVISITEMNKLLQQSRVSSHQPAPKWSSIVDQEILLVKSEIENAAIKKDTSLYWPLYRNISMFERSYELMEKVLKVYVYQEGEKPIFHEPSTILVGIYASEGWFMKLLEADKQFVTGDPGKAHLFYIPFSSRLLQLTLYVRNSHKRDNLIHYMKDYVDMIAGKYLYFNRTEGADHFVAACHDWAPAETRGPMLNCIRALCNCDLKFGFKIGKDVSLPETYVRSANNPLKSLGANPPSQRPILAFFAGNPHGYLRPILLDHWENKDPDMKIFGPMPHVKGNINYLQHMKSSKYCICAKGHEVNSSRVVEAIFYECIPVIISDNFVPPFFEVLSWESFSVFVPEIDIPNLKNILLSISDERYKEMHKRVKEVQQHFLWHAEPVKYDLYYMTLHSIWYNRVFQIRTT